MTNPGRNLLRFSGLGRRGVALLATVCFPVGAASAGGDGRTIPAALLRAVPQEVKAAAFYAGRRESEARPGPRSTLDLATFLVDRAQEFGLVSQLYPTVRVWADGLAAAAAVMQHPHAVALLDIRATARADGGHRLAGLKAAVILHTRGSNAEVEQRIQHLLSTYTNSKETEFSTRQTDEGPVFTVKDRRLPPWTVVTWGPLGDVYVIAVGEGAYGRVAEAVADPTRSLAAQPWFASAFPQASGPNASFVAYVYFEALRDRADPSLARKIEQVQTALRLGGVDRGLWAFRYAGRALEARGVLRREGRDEPLAIAGKRLLDKVGPSVIPDEATRYAVIDCNPRTLIHGIGEAYLASRSPAADQKSRRFWKDLETKCDVSFDRDIFSHLGHTVVIHDYPKHPLRLPVARTLLVRIDGDAEALRRRIDHLLNCAGQQSPQAGLLRLRQDADGVWYLQYGLLGPAVVVTDDWLMVSFSPAAVRQNLATTK